MNEHHEALLRFVQLIVRPVGEVFQVPPASLHIFWDPTGPYVLQSSRPLVRFGADPLLRIHPPLAGSSLSTRARQST